jgi:glycosyltransferase involved in cell wall biosynthesis
VSHRVCLFPPADLQPDAGSTIYSRVLARALTKAGCDVTIVCARTHDSIASQSIIAPIPLRHPFDFHQGTPNAVFNEAISVTVDTAIRQWRPRPGDVIHAIYAGYTAVAAAIVSSLCETVTVVSELGRMVNVAVRPEPRYRGMARLGLSSADYVIAATDEIAETIHSSFGVDRQRLAVLPVPADIDGFDGHRMTRRSGADDGTVVVTTVCSVLTPEKGVLDLVEAFAKVRRDVSARLRLNIVGVDPVAGEPTRKAIHERVGHLGLAGQVSLLGYLPHQELPDILRVTDVYVDPRRVASFSSTIAEAMAMRCPIVAAAVSSNSAFIEHERDALLFEPQSVASLAACLARAVSSAETRERLRLNAPAWLVRHHDGLSPDVHAARVLAIYDAASQAIATR